MGVVNGRGYLTWKCIKYSQQVNQMLLMAGKTTFHAQIIKCHCGQRRSSCQNIKKNRNVKEQKAKMLENHEEKLTAIFHLIRGDLTITINNPKITIIKRKKTLVG